MLKLKKEEDMNGIVGQAELRCLSCKKLVRAEIRRYGNGYVTICPSCHKLAYNSQEAPPGMKESK
ncbi:MAG: hypothetical protein COS29_00320 [Candidatus Omnitrophica bacterium CG02_land_8_20_14_3_00__42_8]|nr:MAG: hypothetical protein COS29_00320 [Candidatus Omnitrophica bacterium CG02_land_8_20_14_3_00__42_8]